MASGGSYGFCGAWNSEIGGVGKGIECDSELKLADSFLWADVGPVVLLKDGGDRAVLERCTLLIEESTSLCRRALTGRSMCFRRHSKTWPISLR